MANWTADYLLGRYLVTLDGARWRIYWYAAPYLHVECGAERGKWPMERIKWAISSGLMNLE